MVDPLHSSNSGQQAAKPAASSAQTKAAATRISEQTIPIGEDQLYNLDAFTSGSEFCLTVNEWLADLNAEDAQASQVSAAAYADIPAIVKAPLSSLDAGESGVFWGIRGTDISLACMLGYWGGGGDPSKSLWVLT